MAIAGLARTYDQSTVIREDFENIIASISPEETPLFAILDREQVFNDVHYWTEDQLRPMTSTLAAAMVGTVGAVKVYVQDTHGPERFPVAATKPILLRVDEEIILATARTTDCLTVTRDYNSSGTAAHASGATVEIIADVGLEGADARSAHSQSRSKPYNYTQVFEKTLQVSGTMQAVLAAGITSSEAEYQAQQRLKEIKIELERSLIMGTRVVGSSSTYRSMGGLWHFISTNKTNASSAAISEANIEDDAKKCYDAGGNPNILLCNSTQAQKITNMYGSRVRTDPEGILGGLQISRIKLPIAGSGELAILVNRWVPQHEYYILDGTKIKIGYLRQFFMEDLAKTGDSTKRQVIGEYTIIVYNEKAHARRYGLLTT